jgi:hypothetical protein
MRLCTEERKQKELAVSTAHPTYRFVGVRLKWFIGRFQEALKCAANLMAAMGRRGRGYEQDVGRK